MKGFNQGNRMHEIITLIRVPSLIFSAVIVLMAAFACRDGLGDLQPNEMKPSAKSSAHSDLDGVSDRRVPAKVVYCKQEFKGPWHDPFDGSDAMPSQDMTDKWVKTSNIFRINSVRGKSVRDAFWESSRTPLASFPAAGYSDAAILLDEDERPLFAIFRSNVFGYYRLASTVVDGSDGYTIDISQPGNRTYVQNDVFIDLLWRGDLGNQ